LFAICEIENEAHEVPNCVDCLVYSTYTVSQKMPLLCLAVTLTCVMLIVFDRNVSEKMRSQKMLYFPASPRPN